MFRNIKINNALRYYCQGKIQANPQKLTKTPVLDVKGLSPMVMRSPNSIEGPAVPGDKSGTYKVPEYFCYNDYSYYEAEIEMKKYRLPQPSAN